MGTKLTKIAQKIFASAAGGTQIAKFGSLAAGAPAFTTDPNEVQSLSNFLTGWFGAIINGASPAIEDMNGLHYLTTRQLAYIMQAGVPEWDAATEYFIGSVVNVGGVQFISKTDNNINNLVTDTTNWKMVGVEPTGTGKDFWGSTLPSGYIWASGKTIGSAASGATERADADTFDLYSMLWSSYDDAALPMFTSGGAASGRGSSAASDFAANKRLTVIDKRGRVSAGKDNMGGTTANRLTNTTIDGTVLGKSGGAQTHTLTWNEMPAHTHTEMFNYRGVQAGGSTVASYNDAGYANQAGTETGSAGGSQAHNNVQPTIVCNYIIKL